MDASQMMEALQTLLRQTQEEAKKLQDEKRRQEAVSYTHLDVYKRQVICYIAINRHSLY